MTNSAQIILSFADYAEQGKNLANALDIDFVEIHLHRFPDGESLIQIPEILPPHVIIYRSMNNPNNKLIELLLTCQTARKNGCETITLVCPYLCYMRQDMEFNPGEAISQQIIGEFLGTLIDNILTVDPHLHRISELDEAVPTNKTITLTAAQLIGEFLRQKFSSAVLVGPDIESKQWVEKVAKSCGFDFVIAEKNRRGDKSVVVTVPNVALDNEAAILVDDMASTGHTLVSAAQSLKSQQVRHIHGIVTHALFSVDALSTMQNAGIEHIWSTDCVSHWSNKISTTELIAAAIARLD